MLLSERYCRTKLIYTYSARVFKYKPSSVSICSRTGRKKCCKGCTTSSFCCLQPHFSSLLSRFVFLFLNEPVGRENHIYLNIWQIYREMVTVSNGEPENRVAALGTSLLLQGRSPGDPSLHSMGITLSKTEAKEDVILAFDLISLHLSEASPLTSFASSAGQVAQHCFPFSRSTGFDTSSLMVWGTWKCGNCMSDRQTTQASLP